jgi:hypothetical protein
VGFLFCYLTSSKLTSWTSGWFWTVSCGSEVCE